MVLGVSLLMCQVTSDEIENLQLCMVTPGAASRGAVLINPTNLFEGQFAKYILLDVSLLT